MRFMAPILRPFWSREPVSAPGTRSPEEMRRIIWKWSAVFYQPSKDQTLRILDTYGDDQHTAVKIEAKGWIYILIQSNMGMADSKIQARQKEGQD